MNKKSQRTKSVAKQSVSTRVIGLLLAGYLVLLLIAQLFTFERFPELIQSIGFSHSMSYVLAIALACTELLALPGLIGLDVRASVIRVSKMSGFVALAILTILELVALTHDISIIGGASLDLPGGWWSLPLIASLWVLLIWSSQALRGWNIESKAQSSGKKA